MNPVPIPLWERCSFLLWKNAYPDSTKPEKKHLLPMNLPENSWPPGQPNISILGKSEKRFGSRPLISDYTTLLGNLLPKDTVHSRSFRYYLPSPTNSNCLPHGGYMMCSMPSSYLLFAPLNHMAPLSHLCLLMSLITKRSMKSRPSSLTRAPKAEDCT